MPEHPTVHITARGGTEFHRHLAVFAYSAYLEEGRGVVLLHQNQFKACDGEIEATVVYVPASESERLPKECADQVHTYDPTVECVFATVDQAGKAMVLTISGKEIGTTPKRLFEKAMTKGQYVPFVPGAVLQLRDSAAGLAPGYYVFIKEEKAEMLLGQVEENVHGDPVGTDVTYRVTLAMCAL